MDEQDDLDETLKVNRIGGKSPDVDDNGELSAAESAVLGRLRERSSDVEALCRQLAALRAPGVGLEELRHVVAEAMRMQAQLGIPAHLLSRGVLRRAGVPIKDLEQARSVVQAVSACEEAAERGEALLPQLDRGSATAPAAFDALERILVSWGDLARCEAELRSQQNSAASIVDLGMERQRGLTLPVCRALVERVVRMGSMRGEDGVVDRFRSLMDQDWTRRALENIGVDVERVAEKLASLASGSPGGRSTSSPERSAPTMGDLMGADGDGPAGTDFSWQGFSTPRSPRQPPSAEGASSSKTYMTSAASTSAARGRLPFPGGSDAQQSALGPSGRDADSPTFTFSCVFRPAPAEGRADAGPGPGPVPPATGAAMPPSRGFEPPPRSGRELDAFAFGPSAIPAPSGFGQAGAHTLAMQAPAAAPSFTPPVVPHQTATPRPALPTCQGAPELWHAVHVGDLAQVSAYVQGGQCHGRMRDASEHSVLWHAISFSHLQIAILMLELFPPGSENGIDAGEVHHRRGDTLLHLLCQLRPFGAETAKLFKGIACALPPVLFEKTNKAGCTFLHYAAASMNFWILKYMCINFPRPMKTLVCAEQPQPPLRALSELLPRPEPAVVAPPEPMPAHFAIVRLLAPDSSGRVPFADVAFDVGPLSPEEGGLAAAQAGDLRARFLAHRAVVAAQSPVLLQELERLPLQHLSQEGIQACIFRVDPRISKDVWRFALQFLYTGTLQHCHFVNDGQRMVELLRACALYKLPKPLLDFVQAALFQVLPNTGPSLALQVFSIAAGTTAEGLDLDNVREAAAYLLFRSAPQVFGPLQPEEVAKVLERLVQAAEQAVFRRQQQP